MGAASVKAGSVDKAVTSVLRSGGVPKAALASAVQFVQDLNAEKIKPVRGFPRGIPVWDRVVIETHVDPSQLPQILKFLQRPGIIGVNILTKGIPVPNIFETQFEISIPSE